MKLCPTKPGIRPGLGFRQGFTLVETLVALAVLAIGCAVLLSLQAKNIDRMAEARFLSEAALLARAKLSACHVRNFTSLESASGDFGPEYPELRWQVTVRELNPAETGLTATGGLLKLVGVRVSSPRLKKEYQLQSVLFRYAGGPK